METSRKYQVRAKCTRPRSGVVAPDSVPRPISFSAPPEFLGEPGVWTPEHSFVAAVATCYMSTFSGMAEVSIHLRFLGGQRRKPFGEEQKSLEIHRSQTASRIEDCSRARSRTGRALVAKAQRSMYHRPVNFCKVTLEPAVRAVPESVDSEAVS